MKTRFFTLFAALAFIGISYAQDEMSVRDSLFNLAGDASVDEPLDMTLLIVNPNYDGDNRAGWEGTSATQVSWGTWENWNHPFDYYQNLGSDLPNGVYELNANALHRVGNYWDEWYSSGALGDATLRTSVLYGQSGGIDVYAPVMDLAACATVEPASEYGTAQLANGTYIPDNPESFHFYTMGGYYAENSTYVVVTDGNLTIGFRDPNYIEGQWSIVDNWQLYYLGSSDEAYALIKEQQTELIQDFSSLFAVESLLESYKSSVETFRDAEEPGEIIDAYRAMDMLRLAVKDNAEAYSTYKKRHDELLQKMYDNEIYGEYRDILEAYLTEYEEPSETYPRGTFDYIIDKRELFTNELLDEISFMEALYSTAVEKGLGNGTNITYMVKNADFSLPNFEGWEWTRTNSGNFYSRTGGKGDGWQQYSDVWLGEAWNCSFDFHQTIENDLPDGIYELDFQALYRPGQNMYFPAEKLPVEVYMNGYTTTVRHIISDGVQKIEVTNSYFMFTEAGLQQVVKYRYQYLNGTNWVTNNNLIRLKTTGETTMYTSAPAIVASSDDAEGWRTITMTLAAPAAQAQTSNLHIYASKQLITGDNTIPAPIKESILSGELLYRDVRVDLRNPYVLKVVPQSYVKGEAETKFRVDLLIPQNVNEGLFPMDFYIEDSEKYIYPDAANTIKLPVHVGQSIVAGKNDASFQYTRTVTKAEYASLATKTVDGVTYKVVPCYFKTSVAASDDTTVYGSNEYFNVGSGKFSNIAVAFQDETVLDIIGGKQTYSGVDYQTTELYGKKNPMTLTFYATQEAVTANTQFSIRITEGSETTTATVTATGSAANRVSFTDGNGVTYNYYRQEYAYQTKTTDGATITAAVKKDLPKKFIILQEKN